MSRSGSRVVFVGNIPYGLSEEQISDIFSSAGRVVHFRLVYDRENGKPKGFGFAEYPDADSAASAVRNLNDYEIMGRKLRVDFSNESPMGEGGDDDDYQPGVGGVAAAGAGVAAAAAAAAAATSPTAAGFSLPPGKDLPPGASAADDISRVLRTLPPTQLLDVLAQMKTLATHEPARATELLAQAPQLAYAVFQALLLMDLVSPEAIHSVVEGAGAGAGAGIAPGVVALPMGVPPPPVAVAPAAAPVPVAAPAAPAAAPAYGYEPPAPAAQQNPDALIQQVLALPQAVIDQLPEAERTQLMALRLQYGGGRV